MITVNDSGVLRTLGGVTVNDGGILKKLGIVQTNDNGTLRKIFEASESVSDLNVGDEVKMKVDDTAYDFIVVHKGLPSSIYDDSCDGIWLLMKDIYETKRWDSTQSTDRGYAGSEIHSYLNDTFYNLLDVNAKNAIKTVKIPYLYRYDDEHSIKNGSNGVSCNVFLLSGLELGWTSKTTASFINRDGACLSYFYEIADISDKRIGYYDDVATNWFTRSSNADRQNYVYAVSATGGVTSTYRTTSFGIRPALILQNTAKVDTNGFIVA